MSTKDVTDSNTRLADSVGSVIFFKAEYIYFNYYKTQDSKFNFNFLAT